MADPPRIVNLSDTFKCNLMQFMGLPATSYWEQELPAPSMLYYYARAYAEQRTANVEQRLLLKAETMRTSASIVRVLPQHVHVCVLAFRFCCSSTQSCSCSCSCLIIHAAAAADKT